MSFADRIYCTIFRNLIKALRFFRFGGTSLPGKLALRLRPGLLKSLSAGRSIIVITGTNGKTTTSRIVANILSQNGLTFFTNKSGANLLSGITTTFIENAGKKTDFVILESDEAAFSLLTKHIKPAYIIVTNFFRDQLDRYGELYSTLDKVKKGVSAAPLATLILNADDSLCASIGKDFGNPSVYYGITKNVHEHEKMPEASDSVYCIFCRSKYDYSYRTIGHLGGYSCNNCGYTRPHPDVSASLIKYEADDHTKALINIGKESYKSVIGLPAMYNVYNALAAISLSSAAELDPVISIKALSDFEHGFGRMEKIKISDKNLNIMLVKNPTGFNSTLDHLLSLNAEYTVCFVINDNIADGRDISWLWDVNFEKILDHPAERIPQIICGGKRAYDMALRLKYFDYPADKVLVEESYTGLINLGLGITKPGQTFYILPTYTAMLDIRAILQKKYGLKEFWK